MTNDERYYKLRWMMSGNVEETWKEVENLAAIACYMDWETFDQVLEAVDVAIFEKSLCGKYNYPGAL